MAPWVAIASAAVRADLLPLLRSVIQHQTQETDTLIGEFSLKEMLEIIQEAQVRSAYFCNLVHVTHPPVFIALYSFLQISDSSLSCYIDSYLSGDSDSGCVKGSHYSNNGISNYHILLFALAQHLKASGPTRASDLNTAESGVKILLKQGVRDTAFSQSSQVALIAAENVLVKESGGGAGATLADKVLSAVFSPPGLHSTSSSNGTISRAETIRALSGALSGSDLNITKFRIVS